MKKEIDIFNDPRCGHDGQPIYEAFDSEEEYNEALAKYKEQFWAEWEEMNRFSELNRTNPEAARAAAEASRAKSEVAPEFAPEPSPPRPNP